MKLAPSFRRPPTLTCALLAVLFDTGALSCCRGVVREKVVEPCKTHTGPHIGRVVRKGKAGTFLRRMGERKVRLVMMMNYSCEPPSI